MNFNALQKWREVWVQEAELEMAHCSLLLPHYELSDGRFKLICIIREPPPNFSITLSVLQASVFCFLKIMTVSHSCRTSFQLSRSVPRGQSVCVMYNITQIRLNRVTHLLCFYRISLFGFSCAVVSLGLTHTMVVYSLIYSFIAVYWSTCNHCLLSHFMSCPLPFSMPWRSFFRFNKIC